MQKKSYSKSQDILISRKYASSNKEQKEYLKTNKISKKIQSFLTQATSYISSSHKYRRDNSNYYYI